MLYAVRRCTRQPGPELPRKTHSDSERPNVQNSRTEGKEVVYAEGSEDI
jgi:hypothetical protein